jgi:hypothetical protein
MFRDKVINLAGKKILSISYPCFHIPFQAKLYCILIVLKLEADWENEVHNVDLITQQSFCCHL